MSLTFRNLLAVFCAISPLLAQGPAAETGKAAPLSKVERKRKAPVAADILRVKLPKAVERKLDNGLTVLIIEDHRLPLVNLRLEIPGAGALYDPPEAPGLANVTAAMLKEGTATRDSKAIAEQVDRMGATISASAPFGSDTAIINASGLSDNFPDWLALAADITLNASFSEAELNKLKQRMKVQLQQQRSSPNFLVNERFSKALYGEHPAAVTSATAASLDSITPAMLHKWRQERYIPQNAILGVAGDITPDALMALLAKLPAWKSTESTVKEVPPAKPLDSRNIFVVDRPGSVQTDVYLGNVTVRRTDPDYISLYVMDRIIGGGPAARLFINLREEKGYTYGAYSRFSAHKWAGPWFAFANMRTDATQGAMTEFLNEINRIRNEKVPESELEEDKRSLIANFALSLEQPTELLTLAMTQVIYGLPADYWDTFPSKIANVTAEQVQAVAKKYLNPEALQIVAVGDAAKIKPVLEKIGPVKVYDTQGKPVS